jgi:hypothetical protein
MKKIFQVHFQNKYPINWSMRPEITRGQNGEFSISATAYAMYTISSTDTRSS